MLRKGGVILSVWCWLNVLPAVASLFFIAQGRHAPALRMRFAADEIPPLDSRVLSVVDGLGTLLNTLIAIYCITCFFLVRMFIVKGHRGALWVFALGAAAIQTASYVVSGHPKPASAGHFKTGHW
jgi:hypothetical protein